MISAARSPLVLAVAFVLVTLTTGPALTQVLPTGPQSPGTPPPPATGSIVGQIVDAGTGRPIPGAIATLSFIAPPQPPLPPGVTLSPAEQAARQAQNTQRRLMTDGSGVFVFTSLAKGSYRLGAEATGYLSGSYGQQKSSGASRMLDLDQGERRPGLTLRLWKYGSISGTITDESGDPAVGVSVRLMRATGVGAVRRFSASSSTQTDDRGTYRFGSLSPADYLVLVPQTVTSMPSSLIDTYTAAMRGGDGGNELRNELQMSGVSMPNTSGVRLGNQLVQMSGGQNRPLAPPSADDRGRTFGYQTIFYPAATSTNEAQPVTVGSGQERPNIDIQLRVARTVRVSGVVTGPGGAAANIGVKLLPAGADLLHSDNGFETAVTATDGLGGFVFPAVPTGSYTIKVLRAPRAGMPPPPPPPPPPPGGARGVTAPVSRSTQPPPPDLVLFATVPVSVGETDVTDIPVVLRQGAHVSGRIVFEGTAPQPTADQLQRMNITLSGIDGNFNQGSSPARPTSSGQFTTVGYPPGRYIVSASGGLQGWYFKSTTLGGRNIDEDPLELESGDISGVTVTFTDHTTQLTGTVRDPSNARDLAATIMIFPANYAQLIERGTIGRRTRQMSAGAAGAFQTNGLLPGQYLVVAYNPDNVSDVRDKAFYDALARAATRVTLADGDKQTVDLTLAVIR